MKIKIRDILLEQLANRRLEEEDKKAGNPKKKIEQGLQGMRPGQAMMTIAKQLDMSSPEFLAKNLLPILIAAAKAGKVKASALKDAVKGFGDKNAEDNTGIDWEKLELDPSTMTYKCLFDGDSKKKLQAFIDEYSKSMEGVSKEAEADNKKLHDAVKKTGLDMSDEEVDENGVIVANSIAGKDKKDKKEVAEDIKKKIQIKKDLEDSIKKMQEQLKKLEAAGVEPKEPDTKKESTNESKDIVNEEENWVADHFDDILAGKYSVSGGSTVDSQTLKNVIYNFASKEKDPEKVTSLVRDWMNSNKKLLSAPSAFRDFMKGETESISHNSLAEFIKQSCKNVDGLKAHVSQAVLDGSSTFNVDYALASSWSEGDKLADFDDVLRQMKQLDPSDKSSVEKAKACIEAYKNYCAQFPAKDVIDGGAFNNNALQAAAAQFQAKTGQTIAGLNVSDKLVKAAEKYKDDVGGFVKNAQKLADQSNIEDLAEKSTKAASNAKEVVSNAVDADTATLTGFSSGAAFTKATKELGVKADDIEKLFARSSSSNSMKMAKAKVEQQLAAFVAQYEKDPDKATEFLGKGFKGPQKDALAELACKIKPEAAEKFKALGYSIDGKIEGVTAKAGDMAQDIADAAAKNAIDQDGKVFNFSVMNKQFDKLEDIFDDGKLTPDELKLYSNFNASMMDYQAWALEHADSTDPQIQQRCAAIMAISRKFNDWEMDNYENLQEMANDDFDLGKVPPEGKKLAAKAASDESMKEAGQSFLGKAFSAIGIARLAAKTTGVILNKGKDVVDVLGAYQIKKKEDKGIIAELKFILSNGEDSDTKFDDTKFSVRYDIDDGKWHATCLDNRKLKFPEEEVIKKVFETDDGKKFKEFCLKRWKDIFQPEDKKNAVIPFILKNFDKLGLKADSKTKELASTISKFDSKFSEIEKNFSSKANESQIDEASDEKGSVDISKDIEDNEELKKDNKLAKMVKAIWNVLKKPLKSFVGTKAGDLIDELLLGQFKDALIKVYKDKKLDGLSSDDATKELEALQKDTNFKNGAEKSALDSRKDDNTSTEIDPATESFYAMWHSKDKDTNVGKILSDIVVDIQKAAKQQADDQKKLAADIKKMKLKDVKDEDIANFGPILKQMVDTKKSPKEIEAKIKELRAGAKESYISHIERMKNKALLTESKFLLTEDVKREAMLRALCESAEMQEAVYQQLLAEGFFSAIAKKIPDKFKQKVKDFGAKTVKALGNKTFQGMLSLAGLGVSIFTGGWAAALILRGIYAVEQHGKRLRNAFERQYKKFANSKGIVTYMNFGIAGNKDAKYSMRFYAKDMVWRVINTADQLKMPGKDFAKAIVEGAEGKKYRERLKAIWDPMFAEAKGGKIDFVALFQQAKELKIPEKQLQMYKDFAEQYDKILAACVESPKIDTRTQSVKKDKLDK